MADNFGIFFLQEQDVPRLTLRLTKPKTDKKIQWTTDTVDNEHLNKKKSKCCCIYDKPKAFGESSSSSEDSDECDHCHGHVEKKMKKKRMHTTNPKPSDSSPDHNHDHDANLVHPEHNFPPTAVISEPTNQEPDSTYHPENKDDSESI